MHRDQIIILFVAVVLGSTAFGQHHDLGTINKLKNSLPAKHGTERIDCLNAIGEEYWWPPQLSSDTIFRLANIAYKESVALNYAPGKATSLMLLGAADIYRRNFLQADKYLWQAMGMYEKIQSVFGLAWCNVWLGQSLYSQNNFEEALGCYKRSIPFLAKLDDWEGEGKVWAWTGMIYAILGNYDSSFSYSSKSLEIRDKMSDHLCVVSSMINMGQLYQAAGGYEDALNYYHLGYRYANAHKVDRYTVGFTYCEVIGALYRYMNYVDSSYYYIERSLQINPKNIVTRVSFGETLLEKHEYDSALKTFLEPLANFREGNDNYDLMRVLMDAAKVYKEKGDNTNALRFATETLLIAKRANARQVTAESYLLLSEIYSHLKINDSAYFFLQQYTRLNDSIVSNQFRFKLSNYKKQADFKQKEVQLALLDKDNKIKEQKLRHEALLKWILIAGLLMVASSGVILYKNLTLKRKNEKLAYKGKQAELQQHVIELEMQALRAQMNPHFIFNCLSSINSFILKNNTESASGYLTKFSRLIRTVLTNSKRPFISLEDELEMLRLYMDMEKLRFKESFSYNFVFDSSVDIGDIFVPPLLLQPFVENAIWHGLMHKDDPGYLEIKLNVDQNILNCVITDNGIGRKKADSLKSRSSEKQKSMGLKITAERLALLNRDHNIQSFFGIDDITDEMGKPAGTRVTLKVNYKDLQEVGFSI